MSTFEGINKILKGDYSGAAKSGLDLTMGYIGTMGPIGFTISGIYFVVDTTVGWDKALESMDRNTRENRRIIPNWSPRPNGGL
jgi:hypothetical protein